MQLFEVRLLWFFEKTNKNNKFLVVFYFELIHFELKVSYFSNCFLGDPS